MAGGDRLARLRTQRHEVGREHGIGAELRLDRHRRRHVRREQQRLEVVEREHQGAEHAVRAVDEGQPLLLDEGERSDAGRGEGVGRVDETPGGVAHFALPHRREGDVGERGEISGAPQ